MSSASIVGAASWPQWSVEMLLTIILCVICLLVGWNLPQPWWARWLWNRIVGALTL